MIFREINFEVGTTVIKLSFFLSQDVIVDCLTLLQNRKVPHLILDLEA